MLGCVLILFQVIKANVCLLNRDNDLTNSELGKEPVDPVISSNLTCYITSYQKICGQPVKHWYTLRTKFRLLEV